MFHRYFDTTSHTIGYLIDEYWTVLDILILVRQKLIPQESLITSAVFAGMVLGAPVWGWDPRGVLGGSLVPWEEL